LIPDIGKDPARRPHGVEEKAINLLRGPGSCWTLREKYRLSEVLLTRMDDRFIPLEERAKLANKYSDLFYFRQK